MVLFREFHRFGPNLEIEFRITFVNTKHQILIQDLIQVQGLPKLQTVLML